MKINYLMCLKWFVTVVYNRRAGAVEQKIGH